MMTSRTCSAGRRSVPRRRVTPAVTRRVVQCSWCTQPAAARTAGPPSGAVPGPATVLADAVLTGTVLAGAVHSRTAAAARVAVRRSAAIVRQPDAAGCPPGYIQASRPGSAGGGSGPWRGRRGEDLPRRPRQVRPPLPFPRVAPGDLLEPDPVVPGGPRD